MSVLTPDELATETGYERSADQLAVLAQLGVRPLVRRDGSLCVTWEAINMAMVRTGAGTQGVPPRPGTVTEMLNRYEADVLAGKAPKTIKEQTRQLEQLRSVFGAMPPDSVSADHIVQYLESRAAKTLADREVALLSHVYTKGIRWNLAKANPCLRVERNNPKPKRIVADELSIMLAWKLAPRHLRAYMTLAHITGQRPADVIDLRETQATRAGIVLVQQKTRREMLLEWTPALRAAWKFAIAQRPVTPSSRHLLCDAAGQPYRLGAIQSAWKRLGPKVIEAGGRRFPLAKLRARSAMDHESGEHLGHSDRRVLEKHYRLGPTKVRPL